MARLPIERTEEGADNERMDTSFASLLLSLWPHLLMTAGLVVLLLVFRVFFIRRMSKWNVKTYETKRRLIVQVRNLSMLLFIVGVFAIWSPLMKTFAISLAALAVAFVIATKELILCLMGGLLKISARPFQIGDRIEVQSFRGDVVDQGLLTTTLFEIGPDRHAHQYTGRTLVLPNSLFLSHPIINEAFTHYYALHTFKIPLRIDEDWRTAEKTILRVADDECKSFIDDCHNFFMNEGRREGLDPPSVKPRVNIHVESPERVELIVRVPTLVNKKGRIEQAIIRRYLESRSASGAGAAAQEG